VLHPEAPYTKKKRAIYRGFPRTVHKNPITKYFATLLHPSHWPQRHFCIFIKQHGSGGGAVG
jgi:hypothetical protein